MQSGLAISFFNQNYPSSACEVYIMSIQGDVLLVVKSLIILKLIYRTPKCAGSAMDSVLRY